VTGVERASLVCCTIGVLAVASGLARADEATVVWMPGNSREIARDTSASRDAPVSALIFAPRVGARGAADFAFAVIRAGGVALRPGFDAFFELEHADPGVRGALPLPGQGNGPMLWRGMYRGSLALSAERLARDWFGPGGALEITMTVGHESDHVTGASFDDAPRRGDLVAGGGGDFAIYDLGLRAPLGARVEGWARIGDRAYFRGAILHAPGLEAGLRWHLAPHVEPVVSLYGEALLADHETNDAHDGGFGGLLAGLALPGAFGELLPFTELEIGNGKGLLINRREVDLAIGFRYAPF